MTYSVQDVEAHIAEILRRVREGETIVLSEEGREVAEIRPLSDSQEEGWTPDELDRALETVPLTGAEIVRGGFTGGWADQGISDGEDWVRERRERRREEGRGR